MSKKNKRKNFRLPNGAGSVFKLSGNRRKPYTAVMSIGYTDQGVLKRKYIGYYESYPEALHALEMFKEVPYDLENKSITIERLYEILKERKQNKSPLTLRSYQTAYNHLAEIQQSPLRSLRTHDFQRILDGLSIKKQGKIQIKNLLNQLYKIAMELDIVNKNYATALNCGESEKSTLHKPFTELEIRKLWELSKTNDFAKIPLILCYTGLRPRELCEIKITDINLEKQYFIGGIKTKAGRDRTIPIHKAILPLFSQFVSSNNEFLIETKTGRKYSYQSLIKDWQKFMQESGLTHTPHDGRHTFITYAKKRDMDALLLKRIVGHASSDLTENTYTHTDYTDLVQAINAI